MMVDLEIRCLIVLLAAMIDVVWGELPTRFHPVVWMGNFISMWRDRCRFERPIARFMYGVLLVVTGCLLFGGVGFGGQLLRWQIQSWPVSVSSVGWLLFVALVSLTLVTGCFSIRLLSQAGDSVSRQLLAGDLAAARQQLAYHLVSRDTSQLDASQVSAAAIESVAENTSDSVVAPVFYYLLFGLPGILVYRFVNTCDAMIGYRCERYLWLGKAAARLDDLLNWVPARLTAILMLLCRPRQWVCATRVWWRDAGKTASPNAGHPMSAAAGLLEIELEKAEHYVLGQGQRQPTGTDIKAMLRLFKHSVAMLMFVLIPVVLCVQWGIA